VENNTTESDCSKHAGQRMARQYEMEQNRTEQNRTEQNRTEQNRTEQNIILNCMIRTGNTG
jgi:hypothetical protein